MRETTLYHYGRFCEEHVADLLRHRRLFCSHPSRLNDPWDCKPFFNMTKLSDPVYRSEVARWLVSQSKPPVSFRDSKIDYLVATDELTVRRVLKGVSDATQEMISRNWRIYCLTPDATSTLMWSHYGQDHRGICLEFAIESGTMFANALQVEYFADYPFYAPQDMERSAIETMLSKALCWKYEREYRLLAPVANRDLGKLMKVPPVAEGYIPLPEGSLRSIVVGSEMPAEDVSV